jgi:hypothetical protein
MLNYIQSFMIDGGYTKYSKQEALELLDMLEDQGMQPPWCNISCHPDYPLDAYIWEPEDE